MVAHLISQDAVLRRHLQSPLQNLFIISAASKYGVVLSSITAVVLVPVAVQSDERTLEKVP